MEEGPDGAGADERVLAEIRPRVGQPVPSRSSDRGHGARTHQPVALHDRTDGQGRNLVKGLRPTWAASCLVRSKFLGLFDYLALNDYRFRVQTFPNLRPRHIWSHVLYGTTRQRAHGGTLELSELLDDSLQYI